MKKPTRLVPVLATSFLAATASIVATPLTSSAQSSDTHGWAVHSVNLRTAKAPASTSKRPSLPLRHARQVSEAKSSETSAVGTPLTATGGVVEKLAGWSGISQNGEVAAFGSTNQAGAPPDGAVAAGPTKVVEFVNSSGWVYDKAGTALASFDLTNLFTYPGEPGGFFESDPRIVYDPSSDRWFASTLKFDANLDSEEFFAVSQTNDPAGSWFNFVYGPQPDLGDQPRIGLSTDKLMIAWDEYQTSSTGNFEGEQAFVFSKAAVLGGSLAAGDVAAVNGGNPIGNVFALVPASLNTSNGSLYAAYNDADATYMEQNQAGPTVALWTISGTMSALSLVTTYRSTAATTIPPAAPQPGGASPLNTDDDRVTEVGLAGNQLYIGLNVPCTPAGDTTTRACVQFWDESVPGTGSTNSTFILGENGKYLMYPSVANDSAGDLLTSFTMSSSSDYPTLQASGLKAGSGSFSTPVTLLAGAAAFTAACSPDPLRGNAVDCRWGDYNAAAQDPAHPTDAWVEGEYQGDSVDGTDWGTGVARLTYSLPTITGLSATSGADCQDITVTGTDFVPGATSVLFNSTPAAAVSVTSPESMTVTPPALTGGVYDITATTAEGTSGTSTADQYTYRPVVTGVSPSSGPSGTSVTVSGCGFLGATAVDFGSTPAVSPTITDTSITVNSPAGPSGTVDVTVVQGLTSATSCSDQYTYGSGVPTVTSASPAGPESGQTAVTITGTGFGCGGTNQVTGVTIGGNPVLSFTVTSATTITATTPAKTPGTPNAADVGVTDGTGTGTGSGAYTYLPTYFFTWYDHISDPGFKNDNIHILNPSSSLTATVNLDIPGCPQFSDLSIAPGTETVKGCPIGFGGPVMLWSTLPVIASQRVQYYQSFNEVPAQPYDASTTELQFAWFDRVSDAGFKNDNIHVIDPGTADANVTVSIPGCPAKTLNVPHGGYDLFTCSTGFGGPVMVTSNNGVPVLASQRVQYYQSFNEEWGQAPGSAAAGLQFSWYDHKSSPGFKNDNIHVWDPTGAALSASSLTVSIPGCSPSAYQASSSELIYSCPFGSGFGGPVTITSTGNPVLASQRVQYYQSFNEVPGVSPTLATTLFYFAWYDHISDPGFKNDNIQVWNPSTTTTAMVSYSIPGNPGCSSASPVAVAPGSYAIFNCSTGFGGPVVVSSTGTGILVSQRVQYYSSFNEVLGAGIYS